MRLKDRVKTIISAIKGEIVPSHSSQLETQRITEFETELQRYAETIGSLREENAELIANNTELLAKNQTLTKYCNDLVNRVETMKKDMNTQIQFMGLINTAVNQICDGIQALPERMESIEKGYLNPLPTEDKPQTTDK